MTGPQPLIDFGTKQALLSVGTRVYNHGDMANPSHFGTITRLIPATKYGPDSVEITRDEPEEGFKDSYVVYASMVGDEFKGHSGTRIVTEKAYQVWRDERVAQMRRETFRYSCACCGNANGKWNLDEMTQLQNPDGHGTGLYCPKCIARVQQISPSLLAVPMYPES